MISDDSQTSASFCFILTCKQSQMSNAFQLISSSNPISQLVQ